MAIYDVNGAAISPSYEDATPNTQIHFNVSINGTHLMNDGADSSSPLSVNAVLMVPSTYSAGGNPTKMIFMHHGQSGTVTDTTWYTQTQYWPNFYNAYLNAGFAVFDVNGSGPYSAADEVYHRDYGCPNGLQAAFKAYQYITKKYNIDKKILVHGTSMGGATAIAFAKTYPEIVMAAGLFAPAELRAAATGDNFKEIIAENYGYQSSTAMVNDGYAEVVASNITLEHYNSSGERQFHPFEYDWKNDSTETHVAQFPVPIKLWQGTNDTSVSPTWSEKIIDAIRLGGGMAYYRPISGAGHEVSTGGNSTAVSEGVLWFSRFA